MIKQKYYLDSASFGSATSVYYDKELSVCAPNGFYSDGITVREQVGCVLLPPQSCDICATACGDSFDFTGGSGVYQTNIDLGIATGAVLIRFYINSSPIGIRGIFNSTVWNKISSVFDGLHISTNPSNFTYIGNVSGDCGISGTTYPSLQNFLFKSGVYVNQGTTESVTVNPGDVSLSSGNPGVCMMVIPKTSASPSILDMFLVGPCPSISLSRSIECPALLPTFLSSPRANTLAEACLLERDLDYYFASISDLAGISLYDFVFSDAYGQYPLPDGFYRIGATSIQVEDGIVVLIDSCGDGILANVNSVGGFMQPCGGGTVDDFMGANVFIDTTVPFDVTFDIRVDYVPIGSSCGGATSSQYFTVTILAGQYGGSTDVCGGGGYYISGGANVCGACISSCSSPSINLSTYSC